MQASQADKKKFPIFAVAEKDWAAHKGDCSGYVRAVGADVGVQMAGLANDLVDFWNQDPGWIKLGNDALKATLMSGQGYLVVGGKKEARHGHVVIVVPGESARHDAVDTGACCTGSARKMSPCRRLGGGLISRVWNISPDRSRPWHRHLEGSSRSGRSLSDGHYSACRDGCHGPSRPPLIYGPSRRLQVGPWRPRQGQPCV